MDPSPGFVEIYDQVLEPQVCQHLISKFESFPQIQSPGRIGSGVDATKKDSLDCCISEYREWEQDNQMIFDRTITCLVRYIRKYPHLACGALAPMIRLDGAAVELSEENISGVDDEQLKGIVFHLYRPGFLNLQKYRQNSGGYHHWHSEIYPRESNCETLHRVLLFMFFLNDVEQGGETEFRYQNLKVRPRQGRMVIAPAGFTHTHKGAVPISGDKYIITSWILFQRAEQIYATPGQTGG